MSKYLHEYNEGRCRTCGRTALFETDDAGNMIFTKENKPIKKANLMICTSCKSVQYCCKEHQVEDWPNHKFFCKRFRKLIAEYKMMRDTRPRGTPKPKKPTPYPLHDFIEEGDWPGLLQYITENPGYDVNADGDQFMSSLVLACGQGQMECVHILLDNGANISAECGSSNLTPLQYASWWGHDDIVQLLLNHGVDVNQTNTHGTYALGFAVGRLQPSVAKLLLRYGADPNQRNLLGWTPLMQLVCMGATIQEDDPNDDNRSDLQRKVEDNPKIVSIAKMLLEAGADINAQNHSQFGICDFRGDTALNMCADDNKVDIMEFLISEGALVDIQREHDGRNALLAAAEYNAHEALNLLIRSGADTTVRDKSGRDYHDLLALPWPRDDDE
ncbi:ankyrin repeat domain-containing protein [Skeletonema marinoi]|uniref:Ankyrin repeat domain-containing protein n=1 Tax=Skeletonema marinoi TaxID=267567 RepID=A0AAD8XV44_9STRA|nr:ankyrin repeat domain-containing protein [Skeletonema marinoi]